MGFLQAGSAKPPVQISFVERSHRRGNSIRVEGNEVTVHPVSGEYLTSAEVDHLDDRIQELRMVSDRVQETIGGSRLATGFSECVLPVGIGDGDRYPEQPIGGDVDSRN